MTGTVRVLMVEIVKSGAHRRIALLTDPIPELGGWSLVAIRQEKWDFGVYEHSQGADERFALLTAGTVPISPPRVLAVRSAGLIPLSGHVGSASLGSTTAFLAEALRQYTRGDGEIA